MQMTKTYRHIKTLDEVREVAKLLQEMINLQEEGSKLLLALDVETYLLDHVEEDVVPRPIKFNGKYQGMIKTLQIGIDPKIKDIQFIIDVELIGKPKEIGNILRDVLIQAVVLGQNLKYEYQFLAVHLGIFLNDMRDVMLISQIIKSGDKLSHSLANLYARYLDGAVFHRMTGKTFQEYSTFKYGSQKSTWRGLLSDDQLQYASDDVRLVFPLYDALLDYVDDFIEVHEKHNKLNQSVINVILLECSLIGIFAMMEIRGVKFDREHHQGYTMRFLEEQAANAQIEVGKYFTHEVKKSNGLRGKARQTWMERETINISSTKQLAEALEAAGVELPKEEKTAAATLMKLKDKHPAIIHILHYKKASSLLSKFGMKLVTIAGIDGIIHASWFQIGSDDSSIDTGRSSCKDPNLMQIPNREDDNFMAWGKTAADLFRKSFIARAGSVLIDADYSQFEPRIQCQLANEVEQAKAFIHAYENGYEVDLHALTAKAAFGLDYLPSKAEIDKLKKEGKDDLAKEYKKKRDTGKILNLGIGYGMGSAKLARNITEETGEYCDDKKARRIIEQYYENLPGIKAMKTRVERTVRKKADAFESLTPFADRKPIAVMFTELGRPRRWCLRVGDPDQEKMAIMEPQRLDKWFEEPGRKMNEFTRRLSECSREAYNFIIQGANADMLKQALRLIQNEFDARGWDPFREGVLMVVHDEILVEVFQEHAAEAKEIVETCMKKATEYLLTDVPVVISIGVGQNWADIH